MKDSQLPDDWVKTACAANPIQAVLDPATGKPNGNFLTGPVRLAFTDTLFEARKPSDRQNDPSAKGKYGVMALYTPYSIMQPLYDEYYRRVGMEFPDHWNGSSYVGLETPFHDQGAKFKYEGFTTGLPYINHTSSYQPQIVDMRHNLIVDRAKVYPGVWAILAVNAYAYGRSPPQPKKGASFGLVQVMIIADDKRTAGGPPDAKTTFAAVNVRPPVVAPSAAFGAQPAPGAAPPTAAPPYMPPPAGMPAPVPPYAPPEEDMSQFM